MTDEFFRANVGAVIVDADGRALVFRRAASKDEAWQLPQGGIELGETPEVAVYREIEEETSISPAMLELLAVAPEWLSYELPPQMRSAKTGMGQTQKWFLFRFHGADQDIKPNPTEFAAYKWSTPEEVILHVVAFRKSVYERVFACFAPALRQAR